MCHEAGVLRMPSIVHASWAICVCGVAPHHGPPLSSKFRHDLFFQIDILFIEEAKSFSNHRISDLISDSGFLVTEAPNTQNHTHGGVATIYKSQVGNSFICEFVRIPLTRPNRTSLTSVGGR